MASIAKSLNPPKKTSSRRSGTFRLFSLPHVPFDNCLRFFKWQEQVNFSLCSRQTRCLSRALFKEVTYLKVHVNKHITLVLTYRNDDTVRLKIVVFDEKYRNAEELPLNEAVKHCDSDPPPIISFWEDSFKGATQWIHHFAKAFRTEYHTIFVGATRTPDFKKSIDWANSSDNLPYCYICINGDELSVKKLNYACARAISTIVIPQEALPRKGYKCKSGFDCRQFSGFGTSWIGVQSVVRSKAKYFYVRESTLTDKDFNRILKSWVRGGLSDIHVMQVERTDPIDVNVVMEGIEHVIGGEFDWFVLTSSRTMNEMLPPAKILTNKYGMTCEVVMHESSNVPGHHFFHIVVEELCLNDPCFT